MVHGLNIAGRDDAIQPFNLGRLHLGGRLVRLGPALDRILSQHDYPEAISRVLGELITITVVLGAGLKFEGRMTAETRGDGPVHLLVADYTSDGDVRAYAGFDRQRLGSGVSPLSGLVGKGVLVMTVDQGSKSDIYQSVVELGGSELADCMRGFFRQSDQIDTALEVAVQRHAGCWRSGAIALQRIAELGPGDEPVTMAERQDAWNTTMVLLSSVTGGELTDPFLTSRDLLYRLFHDIGVRVHEPRDVRFACSCSHTRALTMLRRLPAESIDEYVVDGEIEVVCKFCNRRQTFTPGDVTQPPASTLNR